VDKAILLAELRATIASVPDFDTYTPTSTSHLQWLGKADALLGRWSPIERVPFPTSVPYLAASGVQRRFHLGQMLAVLHRAEADVSLDVPVTSQTVFGPGAVYDFLKALRDVLGLATTSLLIVDPYLDAEIFDVYLSAVPREVHVRLLTRTHASALKPAVERFVAQTGMRVEVRVADRLHDRVVFGDATSCWVLGQSIKDAAKRSATYLAPLTTDAAALKLDAYESVWASAVPL
jgi:hypothetical protein